MPLLFHELVVRLSIIGIVRLEINGAAISAVHII